FRQIEVRRRRRAWHGLCRSCLRFAGVLDREDDAWRQRGPATLSKRSRLGLCSILSGDGPVGGFGDLGEITALPVARRVLVRTFLWLHDGSPRVRLGRRHLGWSALLDDGRENLKLRF